MFNNYTITILRGITEGKSEIGGMTIFQGNVLLKNNISYYNGQLITF